MRVVHISVTDKANGAHLAAFRLHRGLLQLGVDSKMFVMRRLDDSGDGTITVYRGRDGLPNRVRTSVYRRWINRDLSRYRDRERRDWGHFIYDRATEGRHAITQVPSADVIYIHSASGFFDYLRDIPLLARRGEVVFVFRDMAFFTGGCTHDRGCGRFVDRCGACPLFDSHSDNDISRRVWERKHKMFSRMQDHFHLVAPSQWIAREAARSGLLKGSPVNVIPNSVNIEIFRPQDQHGMRALLRIPPEARVVGFLSDPLGRTMKGFVQLIKALETIKDTPNLFLLTGGGGRPPLEIGVPHLHLGRIYDNRLLSAFYSAADIVALPSVRDNLPSVAIEAMACGTPIVAFAVGGIPEMVKDGVTGLLVREADTTAFGAAITALLRDPAACASMAGNGKKVAVERYSAPVIAKRHAEFCARITSSPLPAALGLAPETIKTGSGGD